MWRAATHQGQISNERVREEIRSWDFGLGDVYIWFLIYQSSGNKLLIGPSPRMMSWGLVLMDMYMYMYTYTSEQYIFTSLSPQYIYWHIV
jgi:hypothetical protein